MNKAELVNAIAADAELSQAEAQRALNATLRRIKSALADGDKATIGGFGIFNVTERAARTGRNPATGATIQIPAKKVVKFKPAQAFTNAVQ